MLTELYYDRPAFHEADVDPDERCWVCPHTRIQHVKSGECREFGDDGCHCSGFALSPIQNVTLKVRNLTPDASVVVEGVVQDTRPDEDVVVLVAGDTLRISRDGQEILDVTVLDIRPERAYIHPEEIPA